MKKKIINIVLLAAAVVATSCNDWLDMDPTDRVSEKIVWSDMEYITQYVNGFYPYISRYGSFETDDSMVGSTDGLTETLKYGSMTPGTNVGFANIVAFAEGGMPATTASFHLGAWDKTYERIRRVNEFLYNLKKYGGWLDSKSYARFEAEARFFRGFLYFQILKRTPEAVIYDENLLAITANKPLSTAKEGWDMVETDLKFAAKTLPPTWEASEVGRVTSGAGYALLSRAMLYAERWQSAKDAADEVFKLDYELMPGKTAATYNKAFTSVRSGNTESILEYNYLVGGPNHSYDLMFMPGGDYENAGRATPTQEMVESYEKATDGGFPDWSKWHSTTGVTDTPPYDKLEPRFHASILYNGAAWKERTIEPYIDGKDGWVGFDDDAKGPQGRTTTGYFVRKMLNEKYVDYNSKCTQTWVAIRLAEVHLNRAEACYRLNIPDQANADVRAVRERVGLPYPNDKSGTALFDAIRQERKVELFCEGHLYWDMRRWKLAHTAYTGAKSRVHGLKIEKQGATFIYTYVDCDKQNRLFQEKLYRIPLPETELDNNKAVKQFSEWL